MNDNTETQEKAAAGKRRAALGRGLGALLGDARREHPVAPGATAENRLADDDMPQAGLALLPIDAIEPQPNNPRTHFDKDALDELARSIAARGMIQPVIVRPAAQGRYQLVAGERRWRAAQKAQLHEIPAIIRSLDNREVAALALIENVQREDLNPVEEARAYHRLSEQEGMSQQDIAELVDKSRSHVANLMRLLGLPAAVLAMVETGVLSMGHARALINCEDAEAIAEDAVARQLSVRQVESRVRKGGEPASKAPRRTAREPQAQNDADIAAVQHHLEEFLGLPVRIQADADPRTGSVVIEYKSLDQLDLVCQRLTGGAI